jgi:hypothetical protein
MYFVLLRGTHLEFDTSYSVEMEVVEGVRKIKTQPVVESKRDLVVAFGPDKFRKITKDEADLMLETAGKQKITVSAPAALAISEFQKAAEKGAIAIAEPPGIDSKSKFPELSELPQIGVYFKRGKGYIITDDNKVVTEVAVKRGDVIEWVQNYIGD